jgi:Na+/proline symporter
MVSMMYTGEMGFRYGFAGTVPGILGGLASLVVGTTGFMIGPLRKARVFTVSELLERRFGKGVRWLSGLVVALGGLLNMGIFLRLGGEFLVHVTGLDPAYLKAVMIGLLALGVLYTVVGGMVAVVLTNYFQFLVIGVGMLTISALVVRQTPWRDLTSQITMACHAGLEYRQVEKTQQKAMAERVAATAKSHGPEAAATLRKDLQRREAEVLRQDAEQLAARYVLVDSAAAEPIALTMGNPVDPTARQGVGVAWLIWQILFSISAMATWQTGVSRALSAKDVATSKQIYRLNTFHPISCFLLPTLWAMGAYVFFCHAGGLPKGTSALTAMPEYLARLLPSGVLGMVVAGLLAGEMSTDSSYILTWATVIYNDLITPCLRRPLSEKAKVLTIRTLIVLIGVFLVFYGLVYELPGTAFDYLSVTGTICVASMFTLLIGSLYLPWTNRIGAAAAIVLGAAGPVAFVVVNAMVDASHRIAPATAGLSAYAMAFGGLVVGSLLGKPFLHEPNPIVTEEIVDIAVGGKC